MNGNRWILDVAGGLRALIVLTIVAASSTQSTPAQAANGQCRWEGGPGAPTFEQCRAEDCQGQGGLAECTKGIGVPANPGATGPGKWVFLMCDDQPPFIGSAVNWCGSAGGQWTATGQCINLPPDVLGGGGTMVNSDERAVSISDTWIHNKFPSDGTLVSDTGWGATVPSNPAACGGGSTSYSFDIPVHEWRARAYRVNGPGSGTFTIKMNRGRLAQCPFGYTHRISAGEDQCFKPADVVCPVSNPVSPYDGAKLQTEVDYRLSASGGIEFVRRYNSLGFYQPRGATVPQVAAPGTPLPSDLWRHNYDRRLYLVSGNAEIIGIAHRPDGTVRSFDTAGHEVGNLDGAAATLEAADGEWKLTLADRTLESYDSAGQLQSIRSPAGQITTLSYVGGRLNAVTDAFGRQLSFAYDGKSRLSTVALPDSGTIQFAYDAANRLVSVTYPDNASRTYHYEDTRYEWLLTGITDESNQRFGTYTYDAQGRVIVSEHAGGADRHEFSYGATTTNITDPSGIVRQLGFVKSGGVGRQGFNTAPGGGCGSSKSTIYDSAGNVSDRFDFKDNQTHYTFDAVRNLEIARTDAFGSARARTTTTQWHPTLRVREQIEEPGRRTSFTYDALGNVLTRTVTDLAADEDRTWTYTYNTQGQVLTVDGPRTDVSDVTTYAYNECAHGAECGQVASITDAAGHVTTFASYNANGQPLSIADPNNVVTTLAYDARGRLSSRDVAGETTSFSYYPTGLLKRVTTPDGSYVEYKYDAAHRVTGLEDGEGNRISYNLNAAGMRTIESVYDPSQTLVRTRGWIYDTLGRVISEIDAGNNSFDYVYDPNGSIESTRDPVFRPQTFEYDELNRLTSTVDPMGGVVHYSYSDRDELQSVTDARSLTTSYVYNGFGELTRQTSPDTGVTQLTLDAAGNVHQRVDSRSESATYSYDALKRVTQISYSDQTHVYTYDQGANGSGRLTHLTDASGSTHWTYTAQGRVAGKQQVIGSRTLTVGYGYNAAGQLNQITTPSGQVVGFTYGNGRPIAITVNGATLLNGVLYSPFGPPASWYWSNGTLAAREYDLAGRISAIDSAGLATYQYFPDGRISSIAEDSGTLPSSPDGLTTFDVASSSNRLSASSGLEVRSYSYDAMGSVLGDGVRTFDYDAAGRMTAATGNGGTATYLLNALGQRVKKTVGGVSRLFAYDEGGHLLGEYDNTGNLIQETVWFGDTPVATLRPSGGSAASVFYVHSDHLDTPRRISRPSDNVVVWRWDSDPFGTTAANEDPDQDSNLFVFNLRFPGQYFDAETGLHYNYFRDYDAQTGRYLESDPIGLDGGLNTYAYVGGNPSSSVDPSGEFAGVPSLWANPASAAVQGSALLGWAAGSIVYALLDDPIQEGLERIFPYERSWREKRERWKVYVRCNVTAFGEPPCECPPPVTIGGWAYGKTFGEAFANAQHDANANLGDLGKRNCYPRHCQPVACFENGRQVPCPKSGR